MLQLISNLPAHVVAARAVGHVSKAEYEEMLLPEIDKAYKQFGKVSLLMLLETGVGNFRPGAWLDDVKIGLKHYTHWERIAIVTDQDVVKKIADMFSFLVPGEVKGFPVADVEIAKGWVSQTKTA